MWLVWLLHKFLIKIVSVACVIKCESAHDDESQAYTKGCVAELFLPSLRPPQHIVFINCIKFGHFLTHKKLPHAPCQCEFPSLQTLGLDAAHSRFYFASEREGLKRDSGQSLKFSECVRKRGRRASQNFNKLITHAQNSSPVLQCSSLLPKVLIPFRTFLLADTIPLYRVCWCPQ